MSLSNQIHRWIAIFMVLVVLSSITIWYLTHDRVPGTALIATGMHGGVFNELGSELADAYSRVTDEGELKVLPTHGSLDNLTRLTNGTVDAALLQGGTFSAEKLSVIAPLYPEMVHVIVRRDRGIDRIEDLAGKKVVIGQIDSGMRRSALIVLEHYGLTDTIIDARDPVAGDPYFLTMKNDESLDAAIVTSGILSEDIVSLARTGDFKLLPITAAPALAAKQPYLYPMEIPVGLYTINPTMPAEPIMTIAMDAVLVTRADASPKFIRSLLVALYERGIALNFPNLVPYRDVFYKTPVPLHPQARMYFKPPDQLGLLTNVLESLAAFKELMLALMAGGWLLWDRYRRLQDEEKTRLLQEQKDHLDEFLEETLKIEEAQMDTTDPAALEEFHHDITRIKLKALQQFTDEDLRSDRAFIIFLTQCANLINKIQFKMLRAERATDARKAARKAVRKRAEKKKKPSR
jgi:TRAP transporter TAXI family solute receptor